MDLALVILRLVVGLLVAAHGAQKLIGAFGGPGLHGAAGLLHAKGFRPARLWAFLGSASEVGGGVLFALGLLSPLGSVGIGASMLVAVTKIHWPKLWAAQGGFEYALVILAVAVAVGIAGPGAFSLDAWLGISVPPAISLVVVALAALGYLIGMMLSAAKQTAVAPAAEAAARPTA
jgi:putative oxidoreductase